MKRIRLKCEALLTGLAIFLLLLCSSIEAKAMGWSDWAAQTPGGNTISNIWGPTTLIVKDSFLVEDLNEWYFYKHTIIGRCVPYGGMFSSKYFIYNEHIHVLDSFNSIEKWEDQIETRHLKPVIWTRWYSGDWNSISMVQLSFVVLFLTFLRVILLIENIKKMFGIKRARNVMIYASVILFLLLKCSVIFPGSI